MSRSIPLVAAAVVLLLAPAWSAAQEVQPRSFGAGWAMGTTYVTNLNSNAPAGATELSPGVGFVIGIHVDRWVNPHRRFGFRVQGSYEQPRFDWAPGERKIDTAAADVSLLVRPLAPEEERTVAPYLAAGLGAIWYDLGTGPTTTFEMADAYHDGESRIIPMAVIGLGADIPLGWQWHRLPVQLRVEAADHISFRSPLWRTADDSRHGAVHHLRFTIGAHSTVIRW